MHAFPLDSSMYDAQVEALAGKYRLITPDHRGFGKSGLARDTSVTTMEQLADDAVRVLDELGIDRAVIGGVSMGGYATMALVRAHSDRVQAIILADTTQNADDDAGRARREEVAQAAEKRGMAAIVDAFLPRLLGPAARPDVKARVEAIIRANKPEGSAAALRGMARRPASKDVLGIFDRPALVIVGEDDGITGPDRAAEMVAVLKKSQLIRITGAGHLANLEAPDPFNRALDNFLGAL
jgi:pimeloyl-ACP methyl ester carboxylesterase